MTIQQTTAIAKAIAIYGRVSTAKQEDEETIKTQLAACREYAEKHGYTIVKEYTDEGWSGDILARPALDTLRQDVKNKLWQAVLIYDPDRLARRYSYQELVMDELLEAGIEVLFVTVSTPKNSEDKILHGVRGLFAEYERAKIKERFRIGRLRKAKEGNVLTGIPLYGYTYIHKEEKKPGYYIINEEEAAIVRMIFHWYANGLSIRGIIRKLRDMGIKPRKSLREVWGKSTISRMLRHEGYIGLAHYGSTYGVEPVNQKQQKYKKIKKSARKLKPREEWFFGAIPAIISRDLFDQVQKQLKLNAEHSLRNSKNQYLLSGKIFCSCNSKRFGECNHRKKDQPYYRCSNRLRNFPHPRTCFEKSTNAIKTDNRVWEKIKELMSSPKLLQQEIDQWQTETRINTQTSEIGDAKLMEKEVSKLQKELDRYAKAYGAGIISMQKFKEYSDVIKVKIGNIESQIEESKKISEQINNATPGLEGLQIFCEKVMNVLYNPRFEMKRAVVLAIVETVKGTSDNMVVTGYIPLDEIVHLCDRYMSEQFETSSNHVLEKSAEVSSYTIDGSINMQGLGSRYIGDGNSILQGLGSQYKGIGNSIQHSVELGSKDCDVWNSNMNVKIPFEFIIKGNG